MENDQSKNFDFNDIEKEFRKHFGDEAIRNTKFVAVKNHLAFECTLIDRTFAGLIDVVCDREVMNNVKAIEASTKRVIGFAIIDGNRLKMICYH